MTHPESDSLALMPLVDARARIEAESTTVRFRLLRPPFAAIGLGTLRVLRVRERDGVREIVAGYDGYTRVSDVLAAAAAASTGS